MPPLHGLRLNCVLAPLLAAVFGAVAVLAGALVHRAAVAEANHAADSAVISGLALLGESDRAPSLAVWQAAHPTWRGLARVTVQGESLTILERAGEVPLRDEASPELLLAYQAVQSWSDRGRLAVAAACLPRQGQASVVVGWREPHASPPWWPWWSLMGAVVVLGGGLGLYLVVRVYRPVEWMERAAAAAAAGQAAPPGGFNSVETASLRSSIALLIRERQPHGPVDAKPDA